MQYELEHLWRDSEFKVYGDPLRSDECSFLRYGRVDEVGMADEGFAKQAQDLDEAEQINSFELDLNEQTIDALERHCLERQVGLEANLYMIFAGIGFDQIFASEGDRRP